MASFFDYLQFQARSRPGAPALVHPTGVVEYARLVQGSLAAAANLAGNGLKPGDIAAIRMRDQELHCSVICGAMLAGITTLSLGGQSARPRGLDVAAFLYDEKADTDWPRALQVSQGWLKGEHAAGSRALKAPAHDGIARIICTSGTTGQQKAVPFTETQLIERVWRQVVGQRPHLGPCRATSMMGIMSGVGFTNLMLTLMTGGALFLGWDQARSPDALSLYMLDRLLASPMQLTRLLKAARERHASFPSLNSLVVGGSHVSPQLVRQAQAEICRNLICLYGSTEVGVVATAPGDVIVRNPSAAGYVVPGVKVEAVDTAGKALGPGEEGFLRIHVANAPARYANDEEAGRTAFRDGWFYPGDIGRVAEDGLLFVSGRDAERLNAGGVKVAPGLVEDAVHEWPNVADVAAFEHLNDMGVSEIAVAIVGDAKIDARALLQFCRQHLGTAAPARLLRVREIPRNETGKIDRDRLQEMAKKAFAKNAPAQPGS